MTKPVLTYPEPILRKKTSPVEKITEEIFELVDTMVETMAAEDGVGLAANQVGSAHRVFVINTAPGDEKVDPVVCINPVVLQQEGEIVDEEGCLSFPGLYLTINRPTKVRVYARNLYNEGFVLELSGLLARAAMHEVDHLNGVLFIDRAAADDQSKVEKYCEDAARNTEVVRDR
ncbi:peptide deformylase [candidate division WOR-3 bacterium]|nr:peptide deformylase [candidate division WOR-3 bacterium]